MWCITTAGESKPRPTGRNRHRVTPMGGPTTDESAIERLKALIRIPTVSYADRDQTDPKPFEEFARQLEQNYPLLHAQMEKTTVLERGLLVKWAGKQITNNDQHQAQTKDITYEETKT